ncbi:hypothetical protein ACJ41O_006205 [Fusarium nematophilum]
MAERQKRIPFRALSKNFQDAVVATRALGFRYLWIDSLCIIQDSKEDWDIESARMELVYRNAACTLSASKSADGNGGLFMPRDYRINRPFWLPISPGVDGGQIEPSEKGTFWQPTGIRPTGPLYPRAWVFQEQVLSGRTVAFCSNRVFWDCLTRTESEVNIGSISGAPGAGPFIKFKRLVTQFDSQSCEEAGRTQPLVEAAYAAWYDMLNHYSWRNSTSDLHTEEEEDVMEILGIEVELDGQNTFGRVVAGYLRLKGWVKSARVALGAGSNWTRNK